MTKKSISVAIVLIVIVILAISVVSSFVGVWNKLNRNYQAVEGGKSHYSAALNTCTEKIKGVWEIANQYMKHESETFVAVAQARSGYDTARDAFEKAAAEGKDTEALTQAGTEVVKAAMAFRIQVEAYPELRAVETAQENMRNMESSVNEIKTALDDWVVTIREYNTYRGSAWPSMVGGFMKKFPASIKYYEGEVQKLDVNELNPEKE
ncbi:MAG: LemA family protein [Candidatus Krumholzibacteria bacterium]|nr:LemA family protein [Candidatus Krumholzibacteria bacterium]